MSDVIAPAARLVSIKKARGQDRGAYASREPVRDYRVGFITGHRVRVVVYMIVGMIVLYSLQRLIWPQSRSPVTLWEYVWSWGSLVWLGALLPSVIGFIGLMSYRHPEHLDDAEPIRMLVAWRIVSRGDNVDALLDTVRRCQREMARTPLFPYVIEVIVDTVDFDVPWPNEDVRVIRVPKAYRTPKNTRFKARALHYACKYSPLPDTAWIVHLDEETQPTSSGIKGIAQMISEEERSGELRIGQGAILYHRQWKKYPFLTLADNVRTGDDFARFYFGHRLGVTVFGLHGSYIVTRNDVEKSIGFDFGPKGSITEDAFWALMAMEKGYRCRWVEGYLEEQSTQRVIDFLKQRRRWFQGLLLVALYAPVRFRWRVTIMINSIMWAVTPFALCYTYVNLFLGFSASPWVHFLANFCFVYYVVLYALGLKANMDESGITNMFARAAIYAVQVVLMPVFGFMEAVGAGMSAWPSAGFHVVKK